MNGILCADMDNTIIYSYKRNIGENKLNVELYNGREISFISEKTHDLLEKSKREDDHHTNIHKDGRTV